MITLKDVAEGENGDWLVEGPGGERLVLRRYHDLAGAGWVVPAPVAEVVEVGGRWYGPTRYVPGAAVRNEPVAQRRRRGTDMARVDLALRALGDPLGQRPGWRPQHTHRSVHADVDWPGCVARLGAADPRLGAWAAAAAAHVEAELAAIGAEELPLTLVHGDFAEWNVH